MWRPLPPTPEPERAHTHPSIYLWFFVFKNLSVKREFLFCARACLFYTGTYSTPLPSPPVTVINTWLFPFVFFFFFFKKMVGGISGIEMLKQQEAFLFLFLCFHKGALNILNFWLISAPKAISLGCHSSVRFFTLLPLLQKWLKRETANKKLHFL